jgi:hypothetical protein
MNPQALYHRPAHESIGPPHDPLVCGLDCDGHRPTCPGCRAEDAMRALSPAPKALSVRDELTAILAKFDAADRAMRRAAAHDRFEGLAAAEMDRLAALGDRRAAGEALADLYLLLLRQARQYRPTELQTHLRTLLDPHLNPLADTIARMLEAIQ